MDKILEEIDRLEGEIEKLPLDQQERIRGLAKETRRRHKEIEKTTDEIRQSVSDLRLFFKYLLFDLEATRREHGVLRNLLRKSENESNFEN